MFIMQRPGSHPTLIRDLLPGEIDRLHDIDQICFPAYMAYSRTELLYYLGHPSAIRKVAEIAGKIVGFAIGHVEPRKRAHVITLDVEPEARRRKVGGALMEALHEEFRRRGVARVELEVDTANEAAQQFYARLGYKRGELLRGYYKARGDAYRMALLL
jgi:ribosomal-protein-alanine N-acetyltransferase